MKTSALFLAIMLTILEFRSDAFSPHVGRKLVTRRAQNRRGSSPGHLDCCTSLFYKNGDSDEGLQSPETREIFYNPVHEEVDPWKLPKIKCAEKLDSLMDMEMLYGRIAMVSAIILLATEYFTDRSFLEQFEYALGLLR